MFKKLIFATLCSVALGGLCFAQQTTADATTSNLQAQQGDGGLAETRSDFFQESEEQKQYRELRSRIRNATEQMRNAESSSDRTKAQDELREALAEDYDIRMKAYEEYLDKLEEQLAEMRAKLQRRRDAKSDMVDLRIKVLAAEADDLGWPSSPGRTSGFLRNDYMPRWNTQPSNPFSGQQQSGFGR